ncbi:5'-AMP-activated protein kinase subunit beta-2 isoform X2 [Rattus rattus]|uniref:5'-AMP-activated protein kinase subunit beta-2 isoform X2 n=1 Tax=Rattus rattus TaxID=10117 RepID=UPI0013F35F44|nr:5'-AMP-activated protein kinase subunit beta-2 isoform X2 [Rattus rattus]
MGNTTSERVSGERHGAKAARAEGGGHGPGKEHKIMVGSTDDPSVFSLPDSKLPGDKEFVPWQQDLDDSVKPTQQARPTVIRWSEGGKEVFISGSFNNWSTKIPLIKSHNDFVAILDLPEGEHQYKFFVDGQWVHDPSEPVVTSQLGTINNLIHVKKSDFEVFDALKLDSMESSETSCRGNFVLLLSLAMSFLQCIFLPQTGFLFYFAFSCFSRESYNLTHTHVCTHACTQIPCV